MNSKDTILAPLTPPGQSAVSLIRVSGSGVKEILKKIVKNPAKILSSPRKLELAEVLDTSATQKTALDTALLAYFPAPNSFTGEDCLEFNLHGSVFIKNRLQENLQALGARLASPGEFSQRAFENGRIDLLQAEAICDLVNSETELQAKFAKGQLEGELSKIILELGEPLRDLLAEVEAHIDFPDEDIQPDSWDKITKVIVGLEGKLESLISSYKNGRLIREGAKIVLTGAPNAGKSSLLNLFLGEDRAIVTEEAGTTRDSIEARISLDGLAVSFWDTAGVYEKSEQESSQKNIGQVEKLGIERSLNLLKEADLNLLVIDPSSENKESSYLINKLKELPQDFIILLNKQDLLEPSSPSLLEVKENLKKAAPNALQILISAKTGTGLDTLLDEIKAKLFSSQEVSQLKITNQRHHGCLKKALENLISAKNAASKKLAPEFLACDLRLVLSSLEEIIGVTENEDILGRIFSKFCVGK